MSDTAEVVINGVHIYTHLGGSSAKLRVADALDKGIQRIDEPDYLTRVIIDELERDATGEITGIGVAAQSYHVSPRIDVQVGMGRVIEVGYGDEVTVYSPVQSFIEKYASGTNSDAVSSSGEDHD